MKEYNPDTQVKLEVVLPNRLTDVLERERIGGGYESLGEAASSLVIELLNEIEKGPRDE